MSWWGKLVGGAFGFMIGGPIGALLGAVLGHNFDRGMEMQAGTGAGDQERVQTIFFTTPTGTSRTCKPKSWSSAWRASRPIRCGRAAPAGCALLWIKAVHQIEAGESVDQEHFDHLITLGFQLLIKAAEEIPVPEDILFGRHKNS